MLHNVELLRDLEELLLTGNTKSEWLGASMTTYTRLQKLVCTPICLAQDYSAQQTKVTSQSVMHYTLGLVGPLLFAKQ